jgi:hypothetical protein
MFVTPAIYISGVLAVWGIVVIINLRFVPQLRTIRWRSLLGRIAVVGLVLSLLYASPFGPARDLLSAIHWFVFGYPAWLLFSIICLVPGIVLSKRFALNPFWVLPGVAVAIALSIDGLRHWPPTRWWPTMVVGQFPIPSRYVLGYSIEAWRGYLYSLWPNTFMALVAAVSFLLALRFLRPNSRWSGRGASSSLSVGGSR